MQPCLRTTTLSWRNKGEILGVSLGEEGNEWKAMESLESIVLCALFEFYFHIPMFKFLNFLVVGI